MGPPWATPPRKAAIASWDCWFSFSGSRISTAYASRWRGRASRASQIGGAIAPLLVVPIQSRYGWRASFFVFGLLGVGWAAVWYIWFRDSPSEQQGMEAPAPAGHRFPWRMTFRSESALALMAIAF